MADSKRDVASIKTEAVEVLPGRPDGYPCACRYCRNVDGVLVRPDGTRYSKLDRRKYYRKDVESGEGGHVAKTPLHVARFCVQRFSPVGGKVLDPTVGSGTTIVEAVNNGRSAYGVELQFSEMCRANVDANLVGGGPIGVVVHGDARNILSLVGGFGPFDLVVNNPTYPGKKDEPEKKFDSEFGDRRPTREEKVYGYDIDVTGNLAFLRDTPEFWYTWVHIYSQCVQMLRPGGFVCLGIKDGVAKKKHDLLHARFSACVEACGMEHVATYLLPHYPPTLFMSTYEKRTGVKPPEYQVITVFRKDG